ncbi:hypothetical protein ATEIFO6365_0008040600 [Aspergillus terreus]|uniref:Uncharacterized protein n=1 Tax=Aspergillus terreus TaxID=33178 RepID=A0A5M3Z7Q7_ASPTE|nr:hypothetical protein ATETN484_0010041500 [Aspergillus terreus]GFF18462.1 hypothetical protein ATEIFO6365_0008040600 [Aspergillus terreus]
MSGEHSSQNSHATNTRGGAGIVPTPANNVSGGSGLGDKGYPKGGGMEGLGHVATDRPAATEGEFNSLKEQKSMAENHFMNRMEGHGKPTCSNEDHSFAQHKPGGSDTLPGWNKAKDAVNNMFG